MNQLTTTALPNSFVSFRPLPHFHFLLYPLCFSLSFFCRVICITLSRIGFLYIFVLAFSLRNESQKHCRLLSEIVYGKLNNLCVMVQLLALITYIYLIECCVVLFPTIQWSVNESLNHQESTDQGGAQQKIHDWKFSLEKKQTCSVIGHCTTCQCVFFCFFVNVELLHMKIMIWLYFKLKTAVRAASKKNDFL